MRLLLFMGICRRGTAHKKHHQQQYCYNPPFHLFHLHKLNAVFPDLGIIIPVVLMAFPYLQIIVPFLFGAFSGEFKVVARKVCVRLRLNVDLNCRARLPIVMMRLSS